MNRALLTNLHRILNDWFYKNFDKLEKNEKDHIIEVLSEIKNALKGDF